MAFIDVLNKLNQINFRNFDTYNVVLVTNIDVDIYISALLQECFCENNVYINFQKISYEECFMNENKSLLKNSDMIVVWLNLDRLTYYNTSIQNQEVENRCKSLIHLLSYTNVNILWLGFEDFFLQIHTFLGIVISSKCIADNLNQSILSWVNEQKFSIVFLDLKGIIARIGIKKAFDNKLNYRWNCPYSLSTLQLIAKQIHKMYLIENGLSKKCIILDCDNVLWGGILSEDGVENIILGNTGFGLVYQNFQRYILELYKHGVILAICSKNDLNDIQNMFTNHNSMVLKERHIACFQVNWKSKADNIKLISETLNINLNSFVFIDDSQFEIELVNKLLPEVTTVLFKLDIIFDSLSNYFHISEKIDKENIEKRMDSYKLNEKRVALKSEFTNYDDYIKFLGTTININKTSPMEFRRICELSQRTNKCSNGKRYSISNLKQEIESSTLEVYSVFVKDRFGDLGLVGAIAIKDNSIDLFCLSCRVLGRNIENEMVSFVSINYTVENFFFTSTGKNDDLFKYLCISFNKTKKV